jgi:hypothetical protein
MRMHEVPRQRPCLLFDSQCWCSRELLTKLVQHLGFAEGQLLQARQLLLLLQPLCCGRPVGAACTTATDVAAAAGCGCGDGVSAPLSQAVCAELGVTKERFEMAQQVELLVPCHLSI